MIIAQAQILDIPIITADARVHDCDATVITA